MLPWGCVKRIIVFFNGKTYRNVLRQEPFTSVILQLPKGTDCTVLQKQDSDPYSATQYNPHKLNTCLVVVLEANKSENALLKFTFSICMEIPAFLKHTVSSAGLIHSTYSHRNLQMCCFVHLSLSPRCIPARRLSAPPAPPSLLSGVVFAPSAWYRHHSTCRSPP